MEQDELIRIAQTVIETLSVGMQSEEGVLGGWQFCYHDKNMLVMKIGDNFYEAEIKPKVMKPLPF